MERIIFNIVLYKKSIEESETLLSIIEWNKDFKEKIYKIILWDNSPEPQPVQSIQKFQTDTNIKIDYRYHPENLPLSIIYNRTIRTLESEDILVIWDHDSRIPTSYMDNLIEATNKFPQINLFLPQIYYGITLVSPAKSYIFSGKYLKSINSGIIPSKSLTAINSGMAIRGSYLMKEFKGYNEKIKFYGTDNDFMYKYAKTNKFLYILPIKIIHTLNYYENTDLNNILWRFRDMKNGIMEQAKTINPGIYWLAKTYWLYYSIKTCFKYKKFDFLKS